MIFFMTFHSVGNVIIPTDELIFFRGVGKPPIRIDLQVAMDSRLDGNRAVFFWQPNLESDGNELHVACSFTCHVG